METSTPTLRRPGLELLAASFTVLFQELAIIRWVPGQVRVLAYFPNLILLSAFLGLGLGCLRAGRRSLLWAWPVTLLALAGATWAMGRVIFSGNSASEHLWLLYYDLPRDALVIPDVRLPIVLAFGLSCATFVPLGQIVAERLNVFRARSSALWGYVWDILGSLLGVVAFTGASFAGLRPAAWFAVVFVVGGLFFCRRVRSAVVYLVLVEAVLVIVATTDVADRYSPYYALSIRPEGRTASFRLLANGSLHQFAFNSRLGEPAAADLEAAAREGYRAPYQLLGRPPGRVLVLGAGTGNDVSVLLEMGAEHVDAVEIDPEILRIGRERHPNRPYASPRVRTFNTDARAYLNGTPERYDLVVFGTLDSMTRLSALSNVRLDNFVYTRECLEAARARLAPGGGVVLYFMVGADYIGARLFGTLTEVFGETPYAIRHNYGLFNRAYMVGPAFAHLQGEARRQAAAKLMASLSGALEMPTDDWPYLYLVKRGVSGFYLTLIAVFVVLAVVSVGLASPRLRQGLWSRRRVDAEMLLFGLAFLLLETKAVTDMNLVWGATWLTSGIVFAAILLTILGATLLALVRPLPFVVAAGGLVASLLVAWAVPVRLLLTLGVAERLALSLAFVGTPIFFAASTFALLFAEREHADEAFGWNVIGAVAGGLLEFSSMAVGLHALALVALAAYVVALLVRLAATRRAAAAGPSPPGAEGAAPLLS